MLRKKLENPRDLKRLVFSLDKTMITMILQIDNYNDVHNIYISSKNLLMFTRRNCCKCFPDNILKNFKLHFFRKALDNNFFGICCLWYKLCSRLHTIFDKVSFQCYGFPCIFYDVSFLTFVKERRLFLYFFSQWFILAQQELSNF